MLSFAGGGARGRPTKRSTERSLEDYHYLCPSTKGGEWGTRVRFFPAVFGGAIFCCRYPSILNHNIQAIQLLLRYKSAPWTSSICATSLSERFDTIKTGQIQFPGLDYARGNTRSLINISHGSFALGTIPASKNKFTRIKSSEMFRRLDSQTSICA